MGPAKYWDGARVTRLILKRDSGGGELTGKPGELNRKQRRHHLQRVPDPHLDPSLDPNTDPDLLPDPDPSSHPNPDRPGTRLRFRPPRLRRCLPPPRPRRCLRLF